MPYIMPKEREALGRWLKANDKAPIDARYWVHDSHYSEFLHERVERSYGVVSGRSLAVGDRIEVSEWFGYEPIRGTVRSIGSVGFTLELDEPFTNKLSDEITWIAPSFSAEYHRI